MAPVDNHSKEKMNSRLEHLQTRMRHLIINTCNRVGCNGCMQKWVGDCAATTLQRKLLAAEKRVKAYQQTPIESE